ncbi:hypothetical protein [Lysobacter sp. HA35]
MQNPETVRVVDASPENESGYKVINRDDMTADDVLFDEAPADKPSRARRTKE